MATALRLRRPVLALPTPAGRRAVRRRATERFVVFSQNHDQIGNRALGDRMPSAARRWQPSAPCCRRSRRCCSWVRSTARTPRSSSSATTSTRGCSRRPGRAATTNSRGSRRPAARSRIRSPYRHSSLSALTRESDSALAGRYAELLALRRGPLAPADDDAVFFAEGERWLRIIRGTHQILCNFGRAPVRLAATGARLVFTTTDGIELRDASIELTPLSGAVLADAVR